jgi:carbon storage regulator
MLVLSRKVGESIVINGDIRVVVVSLEGNRCRLGVAAPVAVPVHRQEVYERLGGQWQGAALTFKGRTTGYNPLSAELVAADFRAGNVVLNFTNVRRINSDDLGALVGLHKRLRSAGACLTLICLDHNVREVFAVTRLDSFLTIRDGPESVQP